MREALGQVRGDDDGARHAPRRLGTSSAPADLRAACRRARAGRARAARRGRARARTTPPPTRSATSSPRPASRSRTPPTARAGAWSRPDGRQLAAPGRDPQVRRRAPQVGSGGQAKRALKGKGPTPPAEARKGHPAARRAASAERRKSTDRQAAPRQPGSAELLVGRNPVAEALRAKVPATALYLAQGLDADERVTEAVRIAGNRGIALLEVSRAELDRRTGGIVHQGIALQVPPFAYHALPDLLRDGGREPAAPPLLVALDGVTDPRNLGAVIRSALAFGAHGVVIPERRSAGVTATAWRTSAGAAARLPVAQVTNLVRALKDCRDAGLFVARPRRRRHDVARRSRDGHRAGRRRRRLRGPRAVAAGRRDLRPHGVDPDVAGGRVAQRLGRRRRHPGRGRPPPPRLTPP